MRHKTSASNSPSRKPKAPYSRRGLDRQRACVSATYGDSSGSAGKSGCALFILVCNRNDDDGHYEVSRPESGFQFIHHIVSEAGALSRLSLHGRNPVLNTSCGVVRLRCTQQAQPMQEEASKYRSRVLNTGSTRSCTCSRRPLPAKACLF